MTNSANYRVPGIGPNTRAGSSGNAAVMVEPSPPSESSADSSADTCGCGHPNANHDVVAARYCAATIAGSMARGCICPEGSTASSEAQQPG
jgi:hypothetical protein